MLMRKITQYDATLLRNFSAVFGLHNKYSGLKIEEKNGIVLSLKCNSFIPAIPYRPSSSTVKDPLSASRLWPPYFGSTLGTLFHRTPADYRRKEERNNWWWRLSRWFQACSYISYTLLSHAIENTANQKARIPRCIFCSMQRVIFHEKIPAFFSAYKGFYTFNEQYLFKFFFFFKSKLCTFKKRCQSVEYFFTDCICF